MDLARLGLACLTAALAVLVAALWLVDREGGSQPERRVQPAARSAPIATTDPGWDRAGEAAGPARREERGGVANDADAEAPLERPPDPRDRTAPFPPRDDEAGGVPGRFAATGGAPARARAPSDLARGLRSQDPAERAAAIETLAALPDRALAADLLQQLLADRVLGWNDPAWDRLDTLDPQLRADAAAALLFSDGAERFAAVRLLAGDRWQPAQQVLGQILATTDANYASHGELVATALQSIGEGAGASQVLLLLRESLRAASD